MNRKNLLIIGLVAIIVIMIIWFVVDNYQEKKQQEQLGIFQQGVQVGYQQAVAQLLQQAATCEPVPVFFQNASLNLIAVECIQKAQQ